MTACVYCENFALTRDAAIHYLGCLSGMDWKSTINNNSITRMTTRTEILERCSWLSLLAQLMLSRQGLHQMIALVRASPRSLW